MGQAHTGRFTFAVAVNNRTVLEQNLLASPDLRSPHEHQILIQEDYPSAALAYNAALREAENDLVIFIHQDIFLTPGWIARVDESLQHLEATDPNWGVAGCWGARADGQLCGHIYSSGLGILGREFQHPMPVQTLDEIVLISKKSSGLSFDESLPHFHFYGTDICLRAQALGRKSYVISAFCIHNTRQLLRLPKEFYQCYAHIKRVWKDVLPIQTSCIRVSRFDAEVYRRRVEDLCRPKFLDSRQPAARVMDPGQIVNELEYGKG